VTDYKRLYEAAWGASSDCATIVERVRALADEYERHAGLIRAQEESVGGVDVIQRWRAFEDAAASIRRALEDQ
jgi:hypothetical protein